MGVCQEGKQSRKVITKKERNEHKEEKNEKRAYWWERSQTKKLKKEVLTTI
jgi:hypothetical protein